jgi:hypothetical protein
VASKNFEEDDEVVEDVEAEEDRQASRDAIAEKARRQLKRGRFALMTEKLSGGPERPGEQKVGRSPVVLLLAGSTIGAAILAGIFWFINSRNAEDRLLKEAVASLEQGKYLDAEIQFERFIGIYPKTSSTPTAKFGLHRAKVEKFIMTTTPDVIKGMAELKSFVSECRDLEGFDSQKDYLRRYSDRLTFAGARVAEVAQSQEALDISVESLEMLRKYYGEEGIPTNREQELVNRQRMAQVAVAKKSDFVGTLTTIQKQLEAGDTFSAIQTRLALIDKYPAMRDDRDVAKVLQDILTKEQEFVVRTDVGRDAKTEDPAATALPSLALALRTQATTDLSSQGRPAFSMGVDSCFAVDADTGTPLWRRSLGADPPFGPVEVKAIEPESLIVYSTLTGEVQRLAQADGSLIWRQTLGDGRPTGAPIQIADNFYFTTDAGEMWQIAALTGRAIAKLKFSQKVIGPPAVSSDSQKLIVPGDQTMIYTLGINPFACQAVSAVPHRAGSVKSPMLAAGRNFLLIDNDSAERSRIQTLEINDAGQLSPIAQDFVDGQVNDPSLLRGYELFVPSTPQRVTAFRVTDDAGQPPLAKVGANQLEDGIQTRMFLMAGPGGQVWLGGRDLRKFQSSTNSVALDSGVTAEGIHVQPIQLVDEAVFLTSRNPRSDSVFFTRADREQMKGTWRTVLGSRLVAVAPSATGESLIAVADYGEAYRAPMADMTKGGFVLDSVSRFRLPDKLASPVSGLVLKDGRTAAWCGAPEPSMWTFTTTGQLERKWVLPDAPQAPPVAIDGGVVFAMPGRVHISAIAGGRNAEDYRSSQTQDQQQPWKSLTAISPTQVLAVTGDNQFVRLEYRATPRPQMSEVSVTAVPQIIEVAPAAANGFLFVATTDGKLQVMQASSLEVLGETDLGGVPSASPRAFGEFVAVEVANQEVRIFHVEQALPQTGSLGLEGQTLAGAPVKFGSGYLVARSDGMLMLLDSSGAATEIRKSLGQAIQSGPLQIGNATVVVGLDGSLYAINEAFVQ